MALCATIKINYSADLQAPVTLIDFYFDILDKYTKILDGELFLLFDCDSNAERILLFSTTQDLELIGNCDN